MKPPPSIRTPVVNPDGTISPVWRDWFQELTNAITALENP